MAKTWEPNVWTTLLPSVLVGSFLTKILTLAGCVPLLILFVPFGTCNSLEEAQVTCREIRERVSILSCTWARNMTTNTSAMNTWCHDSKHTNNHTPRRVGALPQSHPGLCGTSVGPGKDTHGTQVPYREGRGWSAAASTKTTTNDNKTPTSLKTNLLSAKPGVDTLGNLQSAYRFNSNAGQKTAWWSHPCFELLLGVCLLCRVH